MPAKKDTTAPAKEDKKVEAVVAEEAAVEVVEEKKAPAKKAPAKKAKAEKKTDGPVSVGSEQHGSYYKDVEVNCICGAKFTINTTVPGPVKVETCHKCHPTYNENKVVKKVIKGRMEQFLEKQKRIDAAKK